MRFAALLGTALLVASSAAAFVPPAEKLVAAAARTNHQDDRTGALRLGVALFTEVPADGVEPIATGELLSDPGKDAVRVDLVGRNGVRERQVVSGGRLRAWRDGDALPEPRTLVPPLQLLQFRYGRSLGGALRKLGVDLEAAELARSDDHDCFVLGGRDRAREPEGFAAQASVWVDVYSYEIVRIDRREGVRFRFGPLQTLGERKLPAWVRMEEQGRNPLYLQFLSAEAAKPAAADFGPPAGSP